MNDKLAPVEKVAIQQDVIKRWRGAWELYGQGVKKGDGPNLHGIARIFLKSVFQPDKFPPAEQFAKSVDPAVIQKLAALGPFRGARPTEAQLQDAEKRLIQRILDVKPATVDQAMETVQQLTNEARFSIWTVGDVDESTHNLPESLVGSKDILPGTQHQVLKLHNLGLDQNPKINIEASDNKFKNIIHTIQEQEKSGIQRFVFMDDTIDNLITIKSLIDQENLKRELMGQDQISYEIILVNQGRKKMSQDAINQHAKSAGIDKNLRIVDTFSQTPEQINQIKSQSGDSSLSVFCDFDGVVTDNTSVRKEWDEIATDVVENVVKKSTLHNPQKEKRGGEKLQKNDLTVANLHEYIEKCKARGLKIGFKNGAYDILQPGHIGGFDDAHDACDILIVGINSDESIQNYKPVKENVPRPIITETQRADVLLGLESVDGVIIFDDANPSELIKTIKPDVYITSDEYRGKHLAEFDAMRDVGGEIVYTSIRDGYSTSAVVRHLIDGFLQVMSQQGDEAEQAANVLKKLAGYA